jgi:hypothetical protein
MDTMAKIGFLKVIGITAVTTSLITLGALWTYDNGGFTSKTPDDISASQQAEPSVAAEPLYAGTASNVDPSLDAIAKLTASTYESFEGGQLMNKKVIVDTPACSDGGYQYHTLFSVTLKSDGDYAEQYQEVVANYQSLGYSVDLENSNSLIVLPETFQAFEPYPEASEEEIKSNTFVTEKYNLVTLTKEGYPTYEISLSAQFEESTMLLITNPYSTRVPTSCFSPSVIPLELNKEYTSP